MSEKMMGYCVEAGSDERGQPRLIIHTSSEALEAFRGNLIYQEVAVRLLHPLPLPPPSPAPGPSPLPEGASDLVARLRRMSEDLDVEHALHLYAVTSREAATRIEELERALDERKL